MANQDKEIFKIEDLEEYKKWISEQNWYQRIYLKNGLSTKAKLKTAFGRSMKSKITSRQLLNKFVKLVA